MRSISASGRVSPMTTPTRFLADIANSTRGSATVSSVIGATEVTTTLPPLPTRRDTGPIRSPCSTPTVMIAESAILFRVSSDTTGGARDGGAHHGAHAHTAGPDDDHRVPVADARRADRGTVARDHAAAGHRGDLRRNITLVAEHPDLLHQRVLGERAELAPVEGGEGERSVGASSGQHVQVGVAEVCPAVGAVPALTAGRQRQEHHRIAH